MPSTRKRPQAPKDRAKSRNYRSQVALDALGCTDGNRRKTRFEDNEKRSQRKPARFYED